MGDKNPYKDLPDMKIYTYDGAKTLVNQEKITWDDDFNINYIFETTKNNRGEDVFINKASVERIVDFMCGEQFDLSEDRNIKEYKVILPFFQNMREKNTKSLWFLPNVPSICALENLLKNHKIFKDYSIINATGRVEGSSVKSLEKFNQEMKQGRDKIICLSCGMLNTGITIKQLNSVVVLQNKKSAQDFFQSIFRCQTPDRDNNKTECYVFDFNPRHYFENFKNFVDSNGGNTEKTYINDNIIDSVLYYDDNVKQVDYETMENYISWDISPDKIKRFFLRANNINLDLLMALNDNQQNIIDIIDKIPMYRNEKQRKEPKERLPKQEKDKWRNWKKWLKIIKNSK